MKTRLFLIATLVAGMAASTASAQSEKSVSETREAQPARSHIELRGKDGKTDRFKGDRKHRQNPFKDIELSDSQKAELDKIMKENEAELKKIREEAKLKMKKQEEALDKKIETVLSPEQLKKYRENKENGRAGKIVRQSPLERKPMKLQSK